jgi:hypothetical protein
MEQFLTWLPALPVLMVLNRVRGGGMSSLTDRLPGRALYYVAVIIGGLTASILDPVLGAIVALGFLIWGAPGWGLWFDLHRDDQAQRYDHRRDDLFVQLVDLVSFGSDHIALFLRMSVFVLPTLAGWTYWTAGSGVALLLALPFGALSVLAYELRWRTSWGNMLSELLVGAIWWVLILHMSTGA